MRFTLPSLLLWLALGLLVQAPVPAALAAPATPAQVITLTQSLSTVVHSGATLACSELAAHYENSYYRVFTPTTALRVNAVQLGVEIAQGGDQPLGVRLHTLSGPLTQANLSPLAAVTATVSNQEQTLLTVPISAWVAAQQPLVAELWVPSGIASNRLLFVGSNTLGQTAPTYLRAPDCGQPEPVDVAVLGAPSAHLVLNVLAEAAPPPTLVVTAPASAPALTLVTLAASGTTAVQGGELAFDWRQVSGPPVVLGTANLSRTTFVVPTTPGALVWALTATDTLGTAATHTLTVQATAPRLAVPTALSLTAPLARTTVHTFSVHNPGDAPLTFSLNAGAAPTAATVYTITHSLSNTVEAGRALKCAVQGFNTEASYYCVFNLPVFGLTGQEVLVNGVTVGVEAATGGGSAGQPVQVRLHRLSGAFNRANLTLLGAYDVFLPDQTASLVTVPVSALVPANTQLVLEVAVPAGVAAGRAFFMGANALGQTAPSYLRAPACGYPEPLSLSNLDPSIHWVMTVYAQSVPCGGLPTAPWLNVTPQSGVVLSG